MELRDVVIIFVIACGVIALKGFYDLFASLPIWFLLVVVVMFLALSGIGIFMLVRDKSKGANVNLSMNFDMGFKHRLSSIYFEQKKAMFDAAMFWLNWPGWFVMLAIWKLVEPWATWVAKASARSFGINAEENLPFFGTAIVLLSLIFNYVGLVLISALFLFVHPISHTGVKAEQCQRCGAKHGLADNYCSNCGTILPKRR